MKQGFLIDLIFGLGISLFIPILCLPNVWAQAPSDAKPPLTKSFFQRGERLYQKQCAVCHGERGLGDGAAAYLLYPKPRDFTRETYRLISTADGVASDEDLFRTISRGMPGSSMPPWEWMSEQDRWAIVYYVRYLEEVGEGIRKEKLSEEEVQAGLAWSKIEEFVGTHTGLTSMEIPIEPPVSDESLTRGRELFLKACAACHGQSARGDGQQLMKDDLGFPTKPRDLTSGLFKGSSSSQELYFRLAAGMPGSPMPSYKEALTPEQIWDLIHYVQSLTSKETEQRIRLVRKVIHAKKIAGEVPVDPLAQAWQSVEPVSISLTPLWWWNDRIEGIEVKVLHNGKEITFHLSWSDSTKDESVGAPQSFSDGVALQFSMESDPPFFGMGDKENPVYLWNWKAAWQKDQTEEKPAAEEGMAKGLGTFTTQKPNIEKVETHGVWENGKWQVVFIRVLSLSEKKSLQLKPGKSVSVAFAVWDGSSGDRNGQKNVSIWNELRVEK